ncbi:unnamed protein product [Cyclocybe aegerita]|uniref:NADP-dependent oxidoreductase domain-containing protein n=1 Tax=Cyclocybe aegerita TaxID=1973307 RepID=A0A8S0WQE7_CYCAE|nr:unnamed protein product [Cyclocybe aegerita]
MSNSTPLRVLGKNGPAVTPVGLGLMAIGAFYGTPSTQEDVDKLLSYAVERGARFWDTSDVYGDSHKLIGNWFAKNKEKRKDIFLGTKYGYCRLPGDPFAGACSDPAYVPVALENALKDLQTDYIDLYYQHRVDPKVPIEVVLESLRPAVESGKVRWLGLSECSVETLRRAKKVPGLGEKLIAVQLEYSPFTLDVEKNGLAAACEELGVALVAYSPLGRGLMSGRYRSRADFEPTDARLYLPRFSEENFHKNLVVVDKVKAIADRLGVTPSQVTLAWTLAAHPTWAVIPGSRSPARVDENTKGAEITLSSEDVKAIRKVIDEAEVGGSRYMDNLMGELEGNCIPLSEWKA